MTWTRLGDQFADAPAMLTVSRSARLLHVEALLYCNKHLTDGAVPQHAPARFSDSPALAEDISELVTAGVWEETPTGWQIDWSEQETAERVLDRRAANARKQQAYRDRGAKHAKGDHSDCTAGCPKSPRHRSNQPGSNPVTNPVSNRSISPVPSRPVPTHREGRAGQDESAKRSTSPSRSAPGDELAPAQQKEKGGKPRRTTQPPLKSRMVKELRDYSGHPVLTRPGHYGPLAWRNKGIVRGCSCGVILRADEAEDPTCWNCGSDDDFVNVRFQRDDHPWIQLDAEGILCALCKKPHEPGEQVGA